MGILGAGRTARTRTGGVYVVWKGYQGRVDAMRPYFDYEPSYIGWSFRSKVLRPLEYLLKATQTAVVLARRRPPVVWAQVPPSPILYVLAAYKLLRPRARVVADCHDEMADPPWSRTPGLQAMLRRRFDVILWHNRVVHAHAAEQGFPTGHAVLLETRPAHPDPADAGPTSPYPHPWVMFPASFKYDEPLDDVLEAARRCPDVTFVLTGDHRRLDPEVKRHVPANVVLTGWIDRSTYKAMLGHADVVLGLTTLEGVQLSAANEATGFGRAMVLSDTRLLRELFPRGAVYAGEGAGALTEAVRTALADQDALEKGSRRLRDERLARWAAQASAVDRLLGRPSPPSSPERHVDADGATVRPDMGLGAAG